MPSKNEPVHAFLKEASSRTEASASDSGATAVILKYLERISHNTTIRSPARSRCMIQDVGEFLQQTTSLLSQLANVLTECPEVLDYAQQRLRLLEHDNDSSDYSELTFVNDKHKILRSIAQSIDKEARSVENFCRKFACDEYASKRIRHHYDGSSTVHASSGAVSAEMHPNPHTMMRAPAQQPVMPHHQAFQPFGQTSIPVHPAAPFVYPASNSGPAGMNGLPIPFSPMQDGGMGTLTPVKENMLGSHSPRPYDSEQAAASVLPSPSYQVIDENQIDAEVSSLLISLGGSRGTGSYSCPYGLLCRKGGLDSSGKPTIFLRNSAFKSHLQKHVKSFVCTLPGCTARQGFARIDQLKRHQDNVPHEKT